MRIWLILAILFLDFLAYAAVIPIVPLLLLALAAGPPIAAYRMPKQFLDMADTLGVSIKTIETHRHNIMEKLNLHSVAELTKYAIREGLTSVDK